MDDTLDKKQEIQENQYQYPYHYIPCWDNGFSQVQHWSWGFRYLGGIKVVMDQLDDINFDSLIDIGCGDGRFLYELDKKYKSKELKGIDYSEKAILLAQSMTDNLCFKQKDILKEPIEKQNDVATAIEVLEHILPSNLSEFIEAIADSLSKEGYFIATIPHINKKVSDKHYQHFSSSKLEELLSPFFTNINFIPFDDRSIFMIQLNKILGGTGENFLITNSTINNWFFNLYLNRYLYAKSESRCLRIAVICQKNNQ